MITMGHLILAIKILLIIVSGYALYKLIYKLITMLRNRDFLDEQAFIILRELSKWVLVVFAILLIFQQFGIEASRILTALSAMFVLVAVGFVAVWSVLSNILCAFLLLVFPPFRFGDVIEIREPDKDKGFQGKVIGLSIFFTTLEVMEERDNGRQFIRIPNTMFFQRIIICHEGKNTQHLKLRTVERDDGQRPAI